MPEQPQTRSEVDSSATSGAVSATMSPLVALAAMVDRERRYGRLPARVREAISRAQDASEILIGWIQLGVLLVFAMLYLASPKTFSEEADFAPVPWALSIYFGFTLVRLSISRRRRLPDWFLYVSVVVDMGLLLGLIWSFHLQYEQPPSFYLKVPTLLYVFIFVALRALRFEVRFVVWAGLVAAGGWLLMVLYAISHDPAMVTRDYVQYMTSNSVLLGAEFDKVISILVVTAILGVAIARAQHLLVQSVVEGSAARDLSRFVPSQVARSITLAEEVAAGQGEVREATILFSDIEGFTGISERLDPQQLIAVLNEYFSAVTEPIERMGGAINQFQGDAILATFNVPEPRAGHALAAISAALEIQGLLEGRTFGEERIRIRSRIGINTGPVLGGLVGTANRLGYTVHGDSVNLAARLEALNKEHGTYLIVSESTRTLVGPGHVAFRRLGAVSVRGRRAPVTIYTVGAGAKY